MTVELILDGTRYACTLAAEPVPEPTPQPSPARVFAFSQRDARWASIHLGTSSYTMGSAGCAVTAATMLATVLDPTLTPGDVVEWLNTNGGFTSGGLLYWAKVAAMVTDLEWVKYYLWRDAPADIDLLHTVLARGPTVVQVDFVPGGALNTHFVVALSMTEDGKDVNIIDPWTGKRGTLLELYGAAGWDLRRAVYAMAEYDLARG